MWSSGVCHIEKGPGSDLLIWLDKVGSGKTQLPTDSAAWDVLESDFRQLVIDCAEQEHALKKIRELSMKDNAVDEYVAAFEGLVKPASILTTPRICKRSHKASLEGWPRRASI